MWGGEESTLEWTSSANSGRIVCRDERRRMEEKEETVLGSRMKTQSGRAAVSIVIVTLCVCVSVCVREDEEGARRECRCRQERHGN